MVMLLRSQTKPLLSVFALMSAWIANLLFAGGVAGILTLTPAYGYWDDYDFKIAVFVLISGTIMYSIYTLFYTLAHPVYHPKAIPVPKPHPSHPISKASIRTNQNQPTQYLATPKAKRASAKQ